MPIHPRRIKPKPIVTLDQIDCDPGNESYQEKIQRKLIKKNYDKRATRGKVSGKS